MVASAGLLEEVHENGDFFGVGGLAEFEIFLFMIAPAADFAIFSDV